jgi:dihydroorotase
VEEKEKLKKKNKKDRFDLVISGGRVIDPASDFDKMADIYIQDGKVVKIESDKREKKEEVIVSQIIDARGKIVCPGLIDIHTHLREPGREDEETIYTGSLAAVAGGFTSICCMPNTFPPIDNQETVKFILEKAKSAKCRVFPIACITKGQKGEEITEVGDLVQAGAVALSDDGLPVSNSQVMRNILDYALMFGIPIISHCEDLTLSGDGVMNESFVSSLLGMKGIPSVAEEIVVSRDIKLAEYTKGKLHIAHVSTSGSVHLVREVKRRKTNVSCEATPHHFSLTDELVKTFNTNLKTNPPLRTKKDVLAIKRGLKDGTIDVVATDHAPHSIEEKDVEFDAAPNGMIGLETALSLVISELIDKNVLSWKEAIAKLTINPAKILNLDLGKIKVGNEADITIIDPKANWVVSPEKLSSKSKNSPFIGKRLKGRAWCTIVGGKVVYQL